MSKIKINAIELETKNGEPIKLSLEEAKELYHHLHELFGKKEIILPSYPIIIDRPYPYNPYWDPFYRPNTTWVSSNTENKISYKSQSGMNLNYVGDSYEESSSN